MLSTIYMPCNSMSLMDHVMHDIMATDHLPRTIASRDMPRLMEHDDKFTVTVMAPGVAVPNLKVTLEHNVHSGKDMLKVVGETSDKHSTHFVNWATSLPRTADGAKATAEAIDGILTVSIPKKALEEKSNAARILSVDSMPRVPSAYDDDASSGETPSDEEDDHTYSLTLRLPGLAAADLSLTLEPALLKIAGETKRTGVTVDRAYKLPRDVDIHGDKCRAAHVDGVLTIRLPKKAAPEPIAIAVADGSASRIDSSGTRAAADKDEAAEADKDDVVMV